MMIVNHMSSLQDQLDSLQALKNSTKKTFYLNKEKEKNFEASATKLLEISSAALQDCTPDSIPPSPILTSTLKEDKENSIMNLTEMLATLNESKLINEGEDCMSKNSDQLIILLEEIEKTGKQLNFELKEAKIRESKFIKEIKNLKAKKYLLESKSDNSSKNNQNNNCNISFRYKVRKLEDALISLQNQNIILNRIVKCKSYPNEENVLNENKSLPLKMERMYDQISQYEKSFTETKNENNVQHMSSLHLNNNIQPSESKQDILKKRIFQLENELLNIKYTVGENTKLKSQLLKLNTFIVQKDKQISYLEETLESNKASLSFGKTNFQKNNLSNKEVILLCDKYEMLKEKYQKLESKKCKSVSDKDSQMMSFIQKLIKENIYLRTKLKTPVTGFGKMNDILSQQTDSLIEKNNSNDYSEENSGKNAVSQPSYSHFLQKYLRTAKYNDKDHADEIKVEYSNTGNVISSNTGNVSAYEHEYLKNMEGVKYLPPTSHKSKSDQILNVSLNNSDYKAQINKLNTSFERFIPTRHSHRRLKSAPCKSLQKNVRSKLSSTNKYESPYLKEYLENMDGVKLVVNMSSNSNNSAEAHYRNLKITSANDTSKTSPLQTDSSENQTNYSTSVIYPSSLSPTKHVLTNSSYNSSYCCTDLKQKNQKIASKHNNGIDILEPNPEKSLQLCDIPHDQSNISDKFRNNHFLNPLIAPGNQAIICKLMKESERSEKNENQENWSSNIYQHLHCIPLYMKKDRARNVGDISSVSTTRDHIGRAEFLSRFQKEICDAISDKAFGQKDPCLSNNQQKYADKLVKKYVKMRANIQNYL